MDPVGTLGLWHAPCGSYLISLQGLALQPLQREKKREKKWGGEEGRKEGVYSWEGGGQTGLVSQAGLQDRALIILWPTTPCMVAENPNRNFSCFPHTLIEERNFFSSRFREVRIMCVLEGQCSLSHTADRRAAREMRNTIYP